MSLRWRGAPPTPPPRDPSGINSIVQQHRSNSTSNVRSSRANLFDPEEDMSSDSSSPPRPDAHHKRRSSYENVEDHCSSSKPPHGNLSGPRRSTPSPRPHHIRSSPCPSLHSRHTSPAGPRSQSVDHWSEATLSDEGEPVRRRPASACRAPRTHRGSMPPVDCLGSNWMHRGTCSPCCGPSPMPYHWCGPPQNWSHLQSYTSNNDSIYESDDLQQKICQLEIEKEQLTLQVNVLAEQVEAQNEKIKELENSLSLSKEQLSNTEALLRQEITSRSSVESTKLELMTQISALRLRLTSVENEKHEIEEKNYKLENELILTCANLAEKEADLTYLQNTYKNKTQGTGNDISSEGDYLEKLKEALKAVIAANDEKERKIQELKLSLNRYKKLQELVFSSRKDGMSKKFSLEDSFHSTLDSTHFSQDGADDFGYDFNLTEKPPPVPRQLQHSLTALPLTDDVHRSPSRLGDLSRQSPFSPIRGESPSPFSSLNVHRYSSSENVSPPTPQKTPPAKRHYSTLPRPHATDIIQQYIKSSPAELPSSAIHSGQTSQSFHNLHHPNYEAFRPVHSKASSGVSFGKGFFKLKSAKRSCSAPELAPDRCPDIPENSGMVDGDYRRTSSPLTTLPQKEKSKGLKKIFGKVKRSGSENLNHTEAEFKRGGIRATAGPRLGWSHPTQNGFFKVDKPFAEWDSSMICDWFTYLGLGMYVQECKKTIKNGEQLLKATMQDFEKEIGIKNALHRKKLLLAVTGAKEQAGDTVEPAGKLDHHWVVRWLDDIGLPQYKDAFFDARVDGRMLHHLTLEDLSYLKVTNLLHHISIKTGIQVLRENNFDGHCLKRRSLPDDENVPSDVSRWTNHRVMEWLRTVDLSEYAPNLRGSGVHGGLMLYEPRFNADLMATLLNIPPNKTLLRRHLTTQFKLLIGPEIMQKKREWEAQPRYTPLSPSAKVKPVRKSHFSLIKKKNKNELAFEDYVCPMNFVETLGTSTSITNGHNSSEEEKFLMKEMVIRNEKILDSMPASNV